MAMRPRAVFAKGSDVVNAAHSDCSQRMPPRLLSCSIHLAAEASELLYHAIRET